MRILQVGDDERMIEHQLPGCRRVAVAFFGDGQRNDRHLRFTHRRQHALQPIDLRMQCFFDHANHAGCPRIGGHLRHGVEVILRFQVGNLLLAANQVNLAVAPVAAVFRRKNVGIHRLMRTVKCAKP